MAVNDVVEVERAGEILVRAVNAGDISALSDFFTSNAVVLPPGRPLVQGANLATFFRNMAMQNEGLRMMANDMEPLGAEILRETGSMSFRVRQRNAERVAYKYLILWQKVSDAWKLSSMAWNRVPAGRGGAARNEGGGEGEM